MGQVAGRCQDPAIAKIAAEMAWATVSLSEYLQTCYRPDCDYIDGMLVERNVGEWDHGRLQTLLVAYVVSREKQWDIAAVTEQRVQVRATRFRIPDISVIAGGPPGTQIIVDPPLVCVEILSPSDTMSAMQERIDDYLTFGVPYIWVVNPKTRRAFIYAAEGMQEAKDGVLRAGRIAVPLSEIQ